MSQLPAKLHFKYVFYRLLGLAAAFVVVSGGWLGWKFYQDASKLTGNKNPLSLVSSFTPSTLKETNGRINILLAGYSQDDSGHQGAELTDSIMILSINPANKSAVVISVPRDLYVSIPGYGYSKINAAYEYGGMGLLEETLSQNLGVQFNYYGLLNYTAFKSTVDAVGGVTTTINSSDPRGLYDPYTNLDLANGKVTLNGQQALNLARARGDSYNSYGFANGDFDRTKNQQALLLALKDKASSASVVSNPLKLGAIADAVGKNVKTDMTVGEIETLYTKAKGISDSNIQKVTLDNYNGQDLLMSYTTNSGQSALVPVAGADDFSVIQSDLQQLLSN